MTDRFSSVQGLRCLTCGTDYELSPMLGGCPRCVGAGKPGILDPVYRYDAADSAALRQAVVGSLWNYHQLLPLPDPGNIVTLGEGGTPLVSLPTLADELGADEVWAKCESNGPTHTWKDRTNSVSIALGRYFGFGAAVCTSSGNHGVALAAFAARAGMKSLVLLSPGAPENITAVLRGYGAIGATVTGNALEIMTRLWQEHGWYISQRNAPGMDGRPFGNPFGMEGYKTISYEIYRQLGGRVPDKVYVPMAGGDGGWGIYKGFHELDRLGLTDRVPEMIACQASVAAPLVNALAKGLTHVEPVATSPTIALSILDSQSGDHALLAVLRSGGTAVGISDDEMLDAIASTSQLGLCIEASSASTLAAARQQVRNGAELHGKTIVLIASGAGERWPATFTTVDAGASRPVGRVEDLAELGVL
jgi:threonine synthase